MAFTPLVNLVAASGTTGASHTTGSFTPAANTTLIVWAMAFRVSAIPNKPTISDSLGTLTWTEFGDRSNSDGAGNPGMRLTGYKTTVGASPASMTVTIASTSATTVGIQIGTELSAEIDTAATWQQVGAEDLTTGDPSFTFGVAPASTSMAVACAIANGTNNFTNPSGYATLSQATVATNRRMAVTSDITSPIAGPSQYLSNGGRSLVLAVEIPVASAGGVVGNPYYNQHVGAN